MARDATAWSVKGIDQATRDIARRAAQAAGMTIGEWIDHAIKADAANRGVRVPTSGSAGTPVPRPEGISADTAEAIFSRIADGEQLFEARLRPIGYALKDVAERVVALERDVEQLPPPEARRIAPPDPAAPGDAGAPEAPAAVVETPAPAEPPPRRPIEFRPVATPPPVPAPPPPADTQDTIWTNEPPADPQSQRPRPIELRPVPRPEPAPDPEAAALSFDAGVPARRDRADLPDGPPATWDPSPDIDKEDLARQAGPPPGLEPVPEPVPEQEPAQADIPEPEPPRRDFPADLVDDDPTTLRQRPEPVPPAADFPADPIDTRALGLSGERIEVSGPRRIASRSRLAVAACIAVALVGGAMWTAHRQGTLNLGAIGDRLGEAEHTLHHALIDVSDWVVAQLAPAPVRPEAPTHPPADRPATEEDAGERKVAVAPAVEPPSTKPADDAPTASEPVDVETMDPADSNPAPPPPEDPARVAAIPVEPASPASPPAPAAAPPLPTPPIPVDPRQPVSPPAAPAIASAPAAGSQTPSQPADAEPLRRAEAGHPAAQFEVAAGMMRTADTRPAEAATWFREAAINGLDVAQFNLGVMYELGVGVPEDQTRALLWYHSAAEQGHPLAQYNLGRLYALGKGIPQSDTEAKRWFARAADRGAGAALHALATYESEEIARERMMHRAAKAGDPLAQAWLRARSAGETPVVGLGPPAGLVLDAPTGAPDIAAIQQGLSDLGYYGGPIDGIAGPMTRAAIGRFQSDNGLPATGLPSRSLRQRLN